MIKLLLHMLPPNYIVTQKVVGAKSIRYKPTILDSINSVVVEVGAVDDIKLTIKNIEEKNVLKNDTLQPMLLLINDNDNPKDFCVYVEKTFYKFTSFISAFDLLFKSHHALNLKYTKEAYNFWYLIQKYIYGINTKYDKPVSSVSSLLSELKK